jgi:hypothetical protein
MTTRHKKTAKNKKRNVAKGRTLSLREKMSRSKSTGPRLRSQTQSQINRSRSRSRSRSSKPQKEFRIVTPENEIYEYYLASSEKEWKQKDKFKGIKKCDKHPDKKSDFPCKMKNTIFNNKKEYDDYEFMRDIRNESTNFKTRKTHYDDIDTVLMFQGSELYRIDKTK